MEKPLRFAGTADPEREEKLAILPSPAVYVISHHEPKVRQERGISGSKPASALPVSEGALPHVFQIL